MYDVSHFHNGRRGAARAAPLPPGEGRGVKGQAQNDLAQGASAFVLDPRGDGVPLPTGGSSSILGSANSTHGEAWQGRRRSACRVAPSSAWQATRARAALPCLAKPRNARRCVILAVRGWGSLVGLATANQASLRVGLVSCLGPTCGRDSYPNGTRQLAGSAELGAMRLAEYSPVRPVAGAAQTNPR